MLEHLKLRGVGPAPEMEAHFGPRLNLLTGDNGLGKTFLLDMAWIGISQTFSGTEWPTPYPNGNGAFPPSISTGFLLDNDRKARAESTFRRDSQSWEMRSERLSFPGLMVYAKVDGGFSVWDANRSPGRKSSGGVSRPLNFDKRAVWNGFPADSSFTSWLCNGLIRDWVQWRLKGGEPFGQLVRVLERLSSSEDEILSPGEPVRLTIDDVQEQPTIRSPHGPDTPLIHASAGVQRIVSLAYILVWSWWEHLQICDLLRREPTPHVYILIDEIEAHLHPKWQRSILPALLDVMTALNGAEEVSVQVIATTHAPLVLASVEPFFDAARDRLFHFDQTKSGVVLEEMFWAKHGNAAKWLVSDVFGLPDARSREGERAIRAAMDWMDGERDHLPENLNSQEAIQRELERVLADQDPFWISWTTFLEGRFQ